VRINTDNWQIRVESVLFGSCILVLDESDIVSLEEDSAEGLTGVPLQVDLYSLVQHQVHVLIETCDDSLNPGVDILV